MSLLNLNLSVEEKSSELIVEYKTIKNGECKETPIWMWSKLKYAKYMVCNKNGEIQIFKID